jgi:hypothetical protein
VTLPQALIENAIAAANVTSSGKRDLVDFLMSMLPRNVFMDQFAK